MKKRLNHFLEDVLELISFLRDIFVACNIVGKILFIFCAIVALIIFIIGFKAIAFFALLIAIGDIADSYLYLIFKKEYRYRDDKKENK